MWQGRALFLVCLLSGLVTRDCALLPSKNLVHRRQLKVLLILLKNLSPLHKRLVVLPE